MSTTMKKLETALRDQFPELDIRSDQCETIRIISGMTTAGCSYDDDHYHAKVISMKGDFDFETKLLAELNETSAEELAKALKLYF